MAEISAGRLLPGGESRYKPSAAVEVNATGGDGGGSGWLAVAAGGGYPRWRLTAVAATGGGWRLRLAVAAATGGSWLRLAAAAELTG